MAQTVRRASVRVHPAWGRGALHPAATALLLSHVYALVMLMQAVADHLIRRGSSSLYKDTPALVNTAATGSVYTDDAIGRFNKKFGQSTVGGHAPGRPGGYHVHPRAPSRGYNEVLHDYYAFLRVHCACVCCIEPVT